MSENEFPWDGSTNISRHTGRVINVPVPLPEQVCIEDVAHCLSNICRFNGRVREFFSVAQHSDEVAMLCWQHAGRFGVPQAEAAMCGLLHDTKEYAIGDVTSPLKVLLGDSFRRIDRHVTRVTDEVFGVTEMMARCRECWRWADLEMLVSDAARWDVFGTFALPGGAIVISQRNRVPPPYEIRFGHSAPLPPHAARLRFLETYRRLRDALFEESREP